jgi:uncharacterized membrane protein
VSDGSLVIVFSGGICYFSLLLCYIYGSSVWFRIFWADKHGDYFLTGREDV